MTITPLERKEAESCGFAGYNGGRHLCLDLRDEGHVTISLKTGDGQLVTFALIPRHEGQGHQCVDIVNHSGPKGDAGHPLQTVAILGAGPTLARVSPEDEATVTTLLLPAES